MSGKGPVVIVYGLPNDISRKEIEELYEALVVAFLEIKELYLKRDQVIFFFPSDRMMMGLGDEIIIFVRGLFGTWAVTEEIRDLLAQKLGRAARPFFPEADLVRCYVELFNPEHGFWSSKREAAQEQQKESVAG